MIGQGKNDDSGGQRRKCGGIRQHENVIDGVELDWNWSQGSDYWRSFVNQCSILLLLFMPVSSGTVTFSFLPLSSHARLLMLLMQLSFFAPRSDPSFLFRIRFLGCLTVAGAAKELDCKCCL